MSRKITFERGGLYREPETPTQPNLTLIPGKFYRSWDGHAWCCFKVDGNAAAHNKHNAAWCVRVEDGRVEYFYIDGRYDAAGKREHTLMSVLYE
jgi:hypothetical protein